MKTLTRTALVLYFFGIGAGCALAQNVVVAIPSNATVVTNGSLGSDNNRTYWLCNAGQVTVSGNNNTVYVDAQSRATVEGNNAIVYNTSLLPVIVRGNGAMVYTNGAGVSSFGNNNVVNAPSGTSVSFDGNNNERVGLQSLQFTYASAPNSPCRVVTSISEGGAKGLTFSPNPVKVGEVLRLSGTTSPDVQMTLVDATGRWVARNVSGQGTLSLTSVRPGMYRVLVTQAGEVASLPVVVE